MKLKISNQVFVTPVMENNHIVKFIVKYSLEEYDDNDKIKDAMFFNPDDYPNTELKLGELDTENESVKELYLSLKESIEEDPMLNNCFDIEAMVDYLKDSGIEY